MSILSVFISVLLPLSVSVTIFASDSKVAPPISKRLTEQRKIVVFPTRGMSCRSCVAQVKAVLQKMSGVKEVKVDLAKRLITVEYVEGTVFPELISAKIADLGYKVDAPLTQVDNGAR